MGSLGLGLGSGVVRLAPARRSYCSQSAKPGIINPVYAKEYTRLTNLLSEMCIAGSEAWPGLFWKILRMELFFAPSTRRVFAIQLANRNDIFRYRMDICKSNTD